MKRLYKITLAVLMTGLVMSCSESFLDQKPVGSFSESILSNKEGVRKAIIGIYSHLNAGGIGMWTQSPFGDVTGSIHGGEYTKGSSAFDYNAINDVVGFKFTTSDGTANGNFTTAYTGVDRCNVVLKLIGQTADMSDAEKLTAQAETRFLRGIFYFHLKKNFYNIPWLDENTTNPRVPNYEGDPSAKNYVDIWPQIIADFEFAAANLPVIQTELARANKTAAESMLAKVLIYSATYDPDNYSNNLNQALTLLNNVISSGVTSKGERLGLMDNYHDNFDAAYEHNKEYIFGIELSTLDGDADGFFASPNSNQGAQFWGFWRDPNGPDKAMGWGFMQPTEWWANHFRTDARGLPYLGMFDGPDGNPELLKDDYGLTMADPFEVDTQGVDPRLDWSIGRRGIDYLGWGEFQGAAWIRAPLEGGPYGNKKWHVWKNQVGVYQSASNCYPAINLPLMRYADVLLLTAEAEVRTGGSLTRARDLVNEVRARMTTNETSARHWVKKADGVSHAANYRIGLYSASNPDDPFLTAEGALDAILYERTLELGGEGHRFFDVVRFGKGLDEFGDYMAFEKSLTGPTGALRYGHYTADYAYEEPKDMFLPIPTTAIDRSKEGGIPTLIQNPGY